MKLEIIRSLFNSGFDHASSSLSRLTSRGVYYENEHNGFHSIENEIFAKLPPFRSEKDGVLIITRLGGDVIGSSYLLLSQTEFERLATHIYRTQRVTQDIKEEFVRELGNVLASDVAAVLASSLNVKILCDSSVLINPFTGDMNEVINDHFSGSEGDIHISSISFSARYQPDFMPQFIWTLDKETFYSAVERQLVQG